MIGAVPTNHKVGSGECASHGAAKNGVRRWQTVYDDPDNQPLREARNNPNQLVPGDSVVVPDKQAKVVGLASGKEHQLVVRVQRTWLRIKLDCPRPASYVLEVGGKTFSGTVNPGGVIEEQVPAAAVAGELIVTTWGAFESDRWTLDIGSLQPIDTLVGVQQRLNNLGLFAGAEEGKMNDATRGALRTFKRMRGTPQPDGELDEATRTALLNEHGG